MEPQEEIILQAREEAKKIIKLAEEAAKLLLERTRKETSQMIVDSIKTAFGQGEEEQKIIRLNRIPYICQDIASIKKDLKFVMKILYLGIGGLTIVSFFIPILVHYILK